MNDRRHLTPTEVEKLLAAAKGSRCETRDRCFLLLAFRHGLRVSEACGLSQRSPDGVELAKRNPGSAPTPRIPASGLHPGYRY